MDNTIKDSGKVRIQIKDGFPIVDIYHDGELSLTDVAWIHQTLLYGFTPALEPPLDIVIDRSGSYSISPEAMVNMRKMMEIVSRAAYVTHRSSHDALVNLAANSYLADKPVGNLSSIEDAINWLKENSENS